MRNFWNHLGILLLGSIFSGAAYSEEVAFRSLLEEDLIPAEKPISIPLMSCSNENPCSTCDYDPDPACRSAFSVGAEIPLLSVYSNHGSGPGNTNWFNEFDTNAALRMIFAYQSPGALGLRGRIFTYDTTGSLTPIDRFDVRLYDLEATTGIDIGDWNLSFFGGGRWGTISYSNRFSNSFENFDGFGMTCGADIRRDVGCGWGLVGGFRQSYLYGESAANRTPALISNTVIPITELRFGIDYTKQLRRGSKLIAGIGFEHQQYSSLSVRNVAIDPEDVDVALSGPVVSLTWLR